MKKITFFTFNIFSIPLTLLFHQFQKHKEITNYIRQNWISFLRQTTNKNILDLTIREFIFLFIIFYIN